MVLVKRIVLDVLKPHQPNGLEFAKAIAEHGADYRVTFTVQEVDEKTETVQIIIEGQDIDFDIITETITSLGGSLHSIDEVEVNSVAEK
jgi:VCBS repeat-containing protein